MNFPVPKKEKSKSRFNEFYSFLSVFLFTGLDNIHICISNFTAAVGKKAECGEGRG